MPRPLTHPQSPVSARSHQWAAHPDLLTEVPKMVALLQETYGFLGGGKVNDCGGSVYADTPLCREIGELLRRLETKRKECGA